MIVQHPGHIRIDTGLDTEFKVPLAISAIGLALFFVGGFIQHGAFAYVAVPLILLVIGIHLLISIPISLGGFILASRLTDHSFGNIFTAAFKIASILLLVQGIGFAVPMCIAFFLALAAWVFLIGFLFDLEGKDLLFTVIALWFTSFFARWLVNMALAAMTQS